MLWRYIVVDYATGTVKSANVEADSPPVEGRNLRRNELPFPDHHMIPRLLQRLDYVLAYLLHIHLLSTIPARIRDSQYSTCKPTDHLQPAVALLATSRSRPPRAQTPSRFHHPASRAGHWTPL